MFCDYDKDTDSGADTAIQTGTDSIIDSDSDSASESVIDTGSAGDTDSVMDTDSAVDTIPPVRLPKHFTGTTSNASTVMSAISHAPETLEANDVTNTTALIPKRKPTQSSSETAPHSVCMTVDMCAPVPSMVMPGQRRERSTGRR